MDSPLEQIVEPSAGDLRREARRRRILETAKSRLERLNGKPRAVGTNNSDAPEVLEYSDPEVEPNIPVRNPMFQDDTFKSQFFATTIPSTSNAEVPNILIRSRAHIFISSILGYILSQYATNCLFLPVGLCLIIELLYYKGQQYVNNNIANLILPIALLFTGVSLGNKIKQINLLLAISQSLMINLAVNIFCICLSSLIFQYISVDHVIEIK